MTKQFAFLAALAIAVFVGPLTATAQDNTSGAISGTVKDKATNTTVEGVIVVVTSVERGNKKDTFTDDNGYFKISALTPGFYTVSFVFGDKSTTMTDVKVNIGATVKLYPQISIEGEKIEIKGANIDTASAQQGVNIDKSFAANIPVPGRSFASMTEKAAGAQDDGQGVSFSGSSSLENQYVVDGINTTGLSAGTVGSPVINEFVEQIEVITGGYQAEYGRSTGGVVNVVTKSGTNDFHGAVFSTFTNSLLQRDTTGAPLEAWIDLESNLAYDLSLGATLGGPIIKDKLWFFAGIAPRVIAVDNTRITKRQTDCRKTLEDGSLSVCDPVNNRDRSPDEDQNGFRIYEELDRSTTRSQGTEYQFVSKINYSPTPEHTGQFTFGGTPFTTQNVGVTGEPQAVSRDNQALTLDLSTKWTSKFNDGETEVEAVAGMHRSTFESNSPHEAANEIPQEILLGGDFGAWARGRNTLTNEARESMKTIEGCRDSNVVGGADPYPEIDNCPDPYIGYSVGGAGFLQDQEEQRTSAKMAVTQRLDLAGQHEFKGGVDVESNFLSKKRIISGDKLFRNFQDGQNLIEVYRYVALAPREFDEERYSDLCGYGNGDPVACDFTPPGDVRGKTINAAAFVQDSWQILPNLTLNAGMRYEEQRLRNAEHIIGTRDPITDELFHKNAMILKNMWAPRVGLVYDWTQEGRSKVYANWGRYYESIPMGINDRSFGGEAFQRSRYEHSQCGAPNPDINGHDFPTGEGCVTPGMDGSIQAPNQGDILNGAGILVAPGIRAQYLDETLLGAEYELGAFAPLSDVDFFDGFKVGISYQNRRLGRILEDLSTDNANTYILANPGEWSKAEENKLLAKIENETDADELARLNNQLTQFRGIRRFDKPRRDYNAVTLMLNNRVSRRIFLQASYTYSRTEGNYQGLFSSDTGQVDPNITSLFDLEELMANRDGPLPQDRPHFFKFDGFYTFDFGRAGNLVTGLSFAGLSGTPRNATGAHYRYGQNETFLLPRGSLGRIGFNTRTDLSLGYGRDLGRGMRFEGRIEFFNVTAFDFLWGQQTAAVGNRYTPDNVNPVVGGRYEDLVFLKRLEQESGNETKMPARRDLNFGNTTRVFEPPWARLTAGLTF